LGGKQRENHPILVMELVPQILYALRRGEDEHHYQDGRGSESLK
jgi:hypothetical protein